MSVNLRRLKAFVTVAHTRSVTEAARELHLTPPAVTKGVRELETELAVELFRRTSSGMLLTPAGEVFHLHAERALSEVERGREEVRLLMGGVGGRVSIGATSEAAINVLPIALGRLIERRPQIEVSMAGGTFDSLSRAVRAGELDFFLGVAPAAGASANLATESLYSDELQVVARPDHPLASLPSLGLGDLGAYRWIQSSSDGPLTHLLRASFADVGVPFPENSIVIEPLSSMRAILRRTDLVAAATSVRVREELALGQLVALPIPLPKTRHIVSIVRRDETYMSGWAKELISLLKRVSVELGVSL